MSTFEEWWKSHLKEMVTGWTDVMPPWAETESRAAYRAGQKEMRHEAAMVAKRVSVLDPVGSMIYALPLEGDE